MQMDFLQCRSADCPMIRIYGGSPEEFRDLMHLFERLSRREIAAISLDDLQGLEAVDRQRVTARSGVRDQGVVRVADDAFDWILTPETWDNVAGLLEPFGSPGAGGFQWLEQAGDVRVLMSHTGRW
jgi:hypothetical protein